MRIAFISQYFYPEQFSNNSIAKELIARGHEVDVVCAVPNYGKERFFEGYSNKVKRSETWNHIRIYRSRTIARGTTKFRLAMNYLLYPLTGTFTALFKIKKRPDVVFVSLLSPITQALVGIALKIRYKTPLVYWLQDYWPDSLLLTLGIRNKLIAKTMNFVCKQIYIRADVILIQSEAFRSKLEKLGVQPKRISFFPNTAPEKYKPIARKKAHDTEPFIPQDGRFRVMFAGNIGESQDFETLVKAAGILRDENIVWLIIGSGRYEQRAKEIVKRLNLDKQFIFLGRHPEKLMPSFFAHADAMIVSLRDTELFAMTIPYKTQCYLACGKPIIASIAGEGAKVVKESQSGFVTEPENPVALAEAIRLAASLPSKMLSQYGLNAREYFLANFGQRTVYDKLEKTLLTQVRSQNDL